MSKGRGLGNIVDDIYAIRSQRLELEGQVKELKAKQSSLEQEFIGKASEQNITSARGHLASASVNTVTVPAVNDWDEFYGFISDHNYFHLLEKRASVGACRELFEKEIDIPGVEPFEKVNVNTQKVS